MIKLLVFDSGLGGLSVLDEVRIARPDVHAVYAADDAAFPYGALEASVLVSRVIEVCQTLIHAHSPELVLIACNTASTLVLAPLREQFPGLPFIGTVPAIKPAALMSRTKRISVLATPATVTRDYTHELIRSFGNGCTVTLIGARNLAFLAEEELRGRPPSDEAILSEILPAFVEEDGARTDVIVLGCTHFPLLLGRLERLAPWPVAFVNPAPAIARRLVQLIGEAPGDAAPAAAGAAVFTSGKKPDDRLLRALQARSLTFLNGAALPFVRMSVDNPASAG